MPLANQVNPWLSFGVLRPCKDTYTLQLLIIVILTVIVFKIIVTTTTVIVRFSADDELVTCRTSLVTPPTTVPSHPAQQAALLTLQVSLSATALTQNCHAHPRIGYLA